MAKYMLHKKMDVLQPNCITHFVTQGDIRQ